MNFCANCGMQVADNAPFCPRCGRPMAAPYQAARPAPQPVVQAQPKSAESMIVSIFGFITNLINVLGFFLFFQGGILMYRIFGYSEALIYGLPICSFGLGLTTFILCLATRQKGERLFSGIVKLVIGVLFLLTVITLYT